MSKDETNQLKGIAIAFMLLLHLFNTYNYHEIYTPYLMINGVPLTFYISLFADCCVVLFLYCSGYGLYFSYKNSNSEGKYVKGMPARLKGLYIKYWVILILFCFILGALLGESRYPCDIKTIILNLTALDTSYNGAWWFFTTYVIILLISPILFKIIERNNPAIVLLFFFVIYTVGYIQRFKTFKTAFVITDPVIEWLLTELALLSNSLLPFILGAYFLKYDILSSVKCLLSEKLNKFKINAIMALTLVAMFVFKIYVPTLYVAVFTGIGFIICYLLIDKPALFGTTLSFLGYHSTNIWLTHMFLYLDFSISKIIVFYSKDPLIIFVTLLSICILFSYIINFIENKINSIREKRIGLNT